MTFSPFSWAPTPNSNPWWNSWIQSAPVLNTHSLIPNKEVDFLDVQIYLSETKKLKAKLYRQSTNCMTLLHFHSHHPLTCKEGVIYSQALHFNMIILEDHILQEELNNLTLILFAHAYPLYIIIKNIKKVSTHNRNHLLFQRPPQTETNICNSFLRYWQTTHSNYT